MIARHIHHALAQVQELQQKILEKQRFKGYSGCARSIGGTIALLGAWIMDSPYYPTSAYSHIWGWGSVFGLAILLNYGSLIYWFLFDPNVKRDIRRLQPVIDVLPPLAVGGIFTLSILLYGDHHYLFGTWMCLFGLANLASRHVLPQSISLLGLLYILAGAICLLLPRISFQNPWPMGITFFIGEWIGGLILHFNGNSLKREEN